MAYANMPVPNSYAYHPYSGQVPYPYLHPQPQQAPSAPLWPVPVPVSAPAVPCQVELSCPSSLHGPSEFSLRLANDNIRDLLARVDAALQSGPGSDPAAWKMAPPIARQLAKSGSQHVVRWNDDGRFYRVVVLGEMDEDAAFVRRVDFGDEAVVDVTEDFYHSPPDIWVGELRDPLALQCSLYGWVKTGDARREADAAKVLKRFFEEADEVRAVFYERPDADKSGEFDPGYEVELSAVKDALRFLQSSDAVSSSGIHTVNSSFQQQSGAGAVATAPTIPSGETTEKAKNVFNVPAISRQKEVTAVEEKPSAEIPVIKPRMEAVEEADEKASGTEVNAVAEETVAEEVKEEEAGAAVAGEMAAVKAYELPISEASYGDKTENDIHDWVNTGKFNYGSPASSVGFKREYEEEEKKTPVETPPPSPTGEYEYVCPVANVAELPPVNLDNVGDSDDRFEFYFANDDLIPDDFYGKASIN